MPAGKAGSSERDPSPSGILRDLSWIPSGALPPPPHLGQAGSGAPRGRFRSAGATEMAPPAAALGAGRARVRAGGMRGAGEGSKGPRGAGQSRPGSRGGGGCGNGPGSGGPSARQLVAELPSVCRRCDGSESLWFFCCCF